MLGNPKCGAAALAGSLDAVTQPIIEGIENHRIGVCLGQDLDRKPDPTNSLRPTPGGGLDTRRSAHQTAAESGWILEPVVDIEFFTGPGVGASGPPKRVFSAWSDR